MKVKVDEYFNNGIIEMARIGQNIVQRNVISEKDHAQLMDKLAEEEPKLKSNINELIKTICDEVLKCDPLQLLNYSQMMFQSSIMGTSSEFQLLGLENMAVARATEYIQSIFVSHEKRNPDAIDDPTELFFDISKDIKKLYQQIHQYYLTLAAKLIKEQTYDNDLIRELLEAQTAYTIRGQRYQIFELDYYRRLLNAHDDIFQKLFSISAGEIIEGIGKLQYALTQGRIDPVNELIRLFESLDGLDDKDAIQIIEEQREKGQELISKSLGIELNDVCSITGWNKGFVEALSYGLGDCSDFFDDSDYSGWPVVDLPVQKRPFIKIDGNYYCFDYYSFSDNLYRAIQKAVSSRDGRYNWSKVQQNASETMAADVFQKLLPGCIVYKNNFYPRSNSLKQLCENDLIVLYYDVLIIVEIKAGSFVFTSPLLDFDQHIKSYKNLIENPENQCQRTYDYLISKKDASFYNEDKSKKASIDMSAIADVYMISVTVDNINTFAARAEKLSFINSNCKAISIAIDDLMIYQDYFESPLYFLHYLKNRREAATVNNLVPTDELDHLGMYINHNCYYMYFNDAQTDRINPIGYREDLDIYYNQKYHPQLSPIKPIQPIPDLFKKMISFLDMSSDDKKIKISNYFLDFCTEDKNSFSSQIEQTFEYQKTTKRIRAITTTGKGKNGLRFSCFVSQPHLQMYSESEQRDYIWSNMLRNNEENRTLIVLEFDDNKNILGIQASFYRSEDIPIERRDELLLQGEQRAKERFNRYAAEHGKKIGRNELCPCGSGKKYKKCCGFLK